MIFLVWFTGVWFGGTPAMLCIDIAARRHGELGEDDTPAQSLLFCALWPVNVLGMMRGPE